MNKNNYLANHLIELNKTRKIRGIKSGKVKIKFRPSCLFLPLAISPGEWIILISVFLAVIFGPGLIISIFAF